MDIRRKHSAKAQTKYERAYPVKFVFAQLEFLDLTIPLTLFHNGLDGGAQMFAWQRMKSLIVIWASLITHLM